MRKPATVCCIPGSPWIQGQRTRWRALRSVCPQVERWARRLAGPRFDAEDIVHDVFLVVLRRQHEFRGEARITTWLFRITAQVVRCRRRNDALRRWLWASLGRP